MENEQNDRVLEIFFRSLHGELISVKKLAEEYNVSTKSISRDINRIKNFLADHRDLMQESELVYSHKDRAYKLNSNEFLKNEELFAIVKVLIGCRCFSEDEILDIISKLKKFTTINDRTKFENIVHNEIYHYHPVRSDCKSVIKRLWQLINVISDEKCITITYYKMNRDEVKRKIKPLSIMFTEYYFYLTAYDENDKLKYFRVDRIKDILEHRERFKILNKQESDEGSIRETNQYMFPGEVTKIKFEFTGLSVQSVLDRLPTAKIVEKSGDKFIIEAEVNYSRGLIIYLMSQGAWIKVLSPQELADDIKDECRKTLDNYM